MGIIIKLLWAKNKKWIYVVQCKYNNKLEQMYQSI